MMLYKFSSPVSRFWQLNWSEPIGLIMTNFVPIGNVKGSNTWYMNAGGFVCTEHWILKR